MSCRNSFVPEGKFIVKAGGKLLIVLSSSVCYMKRVKSIRSHIIKTWTRHKIHPNIHLHIRISSFVLFPHLLYIYSFLFFFQVFSLKFSFLFSVFHFQFFINSNYFSFFHLFSLFKNVFLHFSFKFSSLHLCSFFSFKLCWWGFEYADCTLLQMGKTPPTKEGSWVWH